MDKKSVMHVQTCCFAVLVAVAIVVAKTPSQVSNVCHKTNRDSGTIRFNDATATKTFRKKYNCVISVFIAIIPTHLLSQMWANVGVMRE